MTGLKEHRHSQLEALQQKVQVLKDRCWDLAFEHEMDLQKLPDGLHQEVRDIAHEFEQVLNKIEEMAEVLSTASSILDHAQRREGGPIHEDAR